MFTDQTKVEGDRSFPFPLSRQMNTDSLPLVKADLTLASTPPDTHLLVLGRILTVLLAMFQQWVNMKCLWYKGWSCPPYPNPLDSVLPLQYIAGNRTKSRFGAFTVSHSLQQSPVMLFIFLKPGQREDLMAQGTVGTVGVCFIVAHSRI